MIERIKMLTKLFKSKDYFIIGNFKNWEVYAKVYNKIVFGNSNNNYEGNICGIPYNKEVFSIRYYKNEKLEYSKQKTIIE